MDQICEIYKLIDPRTNQVKYVGQTHCGVKIRLAKHIREAKNQNKTKNHRWINSLVSLGHKPIIEVIEVVDTVNYTWQERETFWIQELSKQYKLNNHTLGGEGTVGFSPTPAMRAAVAKANKERIWTDASRKKASESHKRHTGWHHSELAKKRMSESHKGKIISDETKKNMSDAQKRRALKENLFTQEQVDEIRVRWNNGESIKSLANEFKVYRHTMSKLVNGHTDNIRKKPGKHNG